MNHKISIMIMSGVEDGKLITCANNPNPSDLDVTNTGIIENGDWVLRLGRRDDNDICIATDTYASRYHARLVFHDEQWWLEDLNSRNGTFIESRSDEARIYGTIPVEIDQLFCVGHTWLRIQPPDENSGRSFDDFADADRETS